MIFKPNNHKPFAAESWPPIQRNLFSFNKVGAWLKLSRSGLVLAIMAAIMGFQACQPEQVVTPQNPIQYKEGGLMQLSLTGRTLSIPNLNDTAFLQAYISPAEAVFVRDTLGFNDTATIDGILVTVRKFRYYSRFNLQRFDPKTGTTFRLSFPLFNRIDDTASRTLGLLADLDYYRTLNDQSFLNLRGRVSNLPNFPNTNLPTDTSFVVNNILYDSLNAIISGNFRFKMQWSPREGRPTTDTTLVTGRFSMPVIKAIR